LLQQANTSRSTWRRVPLLRLTRREVVEWRAVVAAAREQI